MSDDAVGQVRELAAKLGRARRAPARPARSATSEAAELAREAAELVSQAGNEIDRALSETRTPTGS